MNVIVHVDMDAFFAAVEVLDNPAYRGKPLIIGGEKSSRRGVVSTCSYEARAYGVHSAMSIRRAVALCPHGIFIPGRMGRYQEVSRIIQQTFYEFSPLVEPLSIDEAFLDMTGCEHFYPDVETIGRSIKARIHTVSKLTASVGIAPNKFLAKLASDHHKPDGLFILKPADIDPFLLELPTKKLWGVGRVAQQKLAAEKIYSVRDLRSHSLEWLQQKFGNFGRHLFELARGIDARPVEAGAPAKSIGQELTLPEDESDPDKIKTLLAQLSDKVGWRLRRTGLYAKTVVLKVRTPNFATYTRNLSFASPVQDNDAIFAAAWQLFAEFRGRPLRLVGVTAANLGGPGGQLSLFPEDNRSQKISEVLDAIQSRYSGDALRKGRSLAPPPTQTEDELP